MNLGDSMADYLEKNQKYCEVIESKIKLDAKPVAMKLIKTEDDLPEGYELIDEKIRHCEMVRKASLGDKFYSTIDQQMCLGGAGAIGLRDMPEKLANSQLSKTSVGLWFTHHWMKPILKLMSFK